MSHAQKLHRTNKTQSPNYNVATLLVLGLVFHLVYIGSVFDCYFKSSVVNGMKSHGFKPSGAPAKRLVLIVGDGLRALVAFDREDTKSQVSSQTAFKFALNKS